MLMILPGDQDLKVHAFLLFKKRKGTPSVLLMGMNPGQFVGPATGCLKLSMQAWLFTNSLNHNYTKIQLYLLSGLSFAYNDSENPIMTPNQTDLYATIRKLWTETQDHIHWDNCREGLGSNF